MYPRKDHGPPSPAPAGAELRAISRRQLILGGGGALAAGVLGARLSRGGAPGGAVPTAALVPSQTEALAVLGRSMLRLPGSRPFPDLPPGTDTMPQIEHFVVLMMENHSFDNVLGVLGRGDGFTLGAKKTIWNPYGVDASNPYGDGRVQHAFHTPTTCQLASKPSQAWTASHVQYAGGGLDGFVESDSGPVAMGYWDDSDLPFTYSLANTFPLGDRWFCSVLGQTDPNRRYLVAATSMGMTDDIGTSSDNAEADATLLLPPPNGTIFDTLTEFGISWADYAFTFPTGATAELYPLNDLQNVVSMKPIDQFYANAASGNLPGFAIVDPDYSTQSQENPQNVVVGEALMEKVVRAIGSSPAWEKTMLVIVYDEHGGYYDHVPPPAALAPDLVPPVVRPGESSYDGFCRYGFRVPAIVVSPYAIPSRGPGAKPGSSRSGSSTDSQQGITHVVHDHTSIMAMLQRKWNLPALTYRDANANDLTDFLDLDALSREEPTFPGLPELEPAGFSPTTLACSATGPGTIPPPGSISSG